MSFRYEGRVDLNGVNIRKEKHGDDRVLAMDLKVEAPAVSADVVAELLGIPAPAFRKTWWDSKGLVNLPNVEPFGLKTKFTGKDGQDSDHRIRFEDAIVVEDRAAIIDKFVAEPVEGHKCVLKFRVAISEPSSELVDLATSCLQDNVKLVVTPDPQLDLGEPKSEPDTDSELDQDEAPKGAADDVPSHIRKVWEQEDAEMAAKGDS